MSDDDCSKQTRVNADSLPNGNGLLMSDGDWSMSDDDQLMSDGVRK